MISTKRLLTLAMKWKRLATLQRKRLSSKISSHNHDFNRSNIASKGHFVVYTMDNNRFELPLTYLSNNVIRELLRISEELFGLRGDQHITLPCDFIFMEFIVTFLKSHLSEDAERALVNSIRHDKCSASLFDSQGHRNQQTMMLPGFYGF